jgi:hypothetical protein
MDISKTLERQITLELKKEQSYIALSYFNNTFS